MKRIDPKQELFKQYEELIKYGLFPQITYDSLDGIYCFEIVPVHDDISLVIYYKNNTPNFVYSPDYFEVLEAAIKEGFRVFDYIKDTDSYHPKLKEINDYKNLPF